MLPKSSKVLIAPFSLPCSCLVKFANAEEATAALKTLSEKVGTNSLAFVRESFGTKTQNDVNTRTDRRK